MPTTLVLNADANPVSVLPLSTVHWQDAIRIMYLGRATVLEEYDCWVVRSPSLQLRMPSVIMLKEFQKHNGKIEFSRYNVILRDDFTCQYRGVRLPFDELTFDHVIPRKAGGKTNWENIVAASYEANQEKAHFNRMKPLRNPYRPSYWELAEKRKRHPITVPHEAWAQYIGWNGDIVVNGKMITNNYDPEQDDKNLPFLNPEE